MSVPRNSRGFGVIVGLFQTSTPAILVGRELRCLYSTSCSEEDQLQDQARLLWAVRFESLNVQGWRELRLSRQWPLGGNVQPTPISVRVRGLVLAPHALAKCLACHPSSLQCRAGYKPWGRGRAGKARGHEGRGQSRTPAPGSHAPLASWGGLAAPVLSRLFSSVKTLSYERNTCVSFCFDFFCSFLHQNKGLQEMAWQTATIQNT